MAVLNFDDPRVAAMASSSPCPVLGYAVEGDAEVRARTWSSTPTSAPSSVSPHRGAQVMSGSNCAGRSRSPTPWRPPARRCGVAFPSTASSTRSQVNGSPLRMEVHRVADGPVVIVDCYNANPASTEAALRALAAVGTGRRLALLGLMAELGAATESEHMRMTQVAEELGIAVIGFQTALYGPAQVDDVDAAVSLLRTMGPADAALVKGSRVACLEEVVRRVDGSAVGAHSSPAGA